MADVKHRHDFNPLDPSEGSSWTDEEILAREAYLSRPSMPLVIEFEKKKLHLENEKENLRRDLEAYKREHERDIELKQLKYKIEKDDLEQKHTAELKKIQESNIFKIVKSAVLFLVIFFVIFLILGIIAISTENALLLEILEFISSSSPIMALASIVAAVLSKLKK